MKALLCKIFTHKWKYLFSAILQKPFKECTRCGDQQYLTQEEHDKAMMIHKEIV